MKVRSALLVLALTFGVIAAGCSSNMNNPAAGRGGAAGSAGSSNSGGTNSSGGVGTAGSSGSGAVSTGGTSGGGSCSSGVPCGGNLVGTWPVSSSCLAISGLLDLSTFVGPACPTAPVTGSLQVSGTLTLNADGTFVDNTTTSGSEQFTLGSSCLVISSTPVTCSGAANLLSVLGYSSLACTDAADGGCNCSGTIAQQGGLGIPAISGTASGSYSTSGNALSLPGYVGNNAYSYCVSGGQLTLTPQTTSPTTTGTIVFGSGGSGAGGASGSGGQSGNAGAGGQAGGNAGAGGQAGGSAGAGGQAGGSAGVAGSGGTAGTGGAAGTSGTAGIGGTAGAAGMAGGSNTGPCDIYKSGGTPCAAAHSTIRALFGAYSGKLYQVRNAGGTTKDINAVAAGGVADAAAQDAFCQGTTCVITTIYDQTGKGNDLSYQGSGSPVGGQDKAASATGESVKIGGNKVYSLYINPSNSYWVDGSQKGIPTGSQPEGMYMVTSGTHFNSGCCFDYGNSETNRAYDGPGTMDALNFSSTTAWGTGAGSGPWVLADLEAGLFAQGGSGKNQNVPTQTATFVTAVLKNNGTSEFALRGGNAASGSLTTYYKGGLPGGWSPMKKQGAMVLGSGGDCCATNTNLSDGTFYEGCLVSGYPSDATENAVQANIVAVQYSK